MKPAKRVFPPWHFEAAELLVAPGLPASESLRAYGAFKFLGALADPGSQKYLGMGPQICM